MVIVVFERKSHAKHCLSQVFQDEKLVGKARMDFPDRFTKLTVADTVVEKRENETIEEATERTAIEMKNTSKERARNSMKSVDELFNDKTNINYEFFCANNGLCNAVAPILVAPNQKCETGLNFQIESEDINRLVGKHYLNERIVNAQMNRQLKNNKIIAYLMSEWWLTAQFYSTKKQEEFDKAAKGKGYWFIPLCTSETAHWTLAVVNIQNMEIMHYDSLKQGDLNKELFNRIRRILEVHYMKTKLAFVQTESAVQTNETDSAVYVLLLAEKLLQGLTGEALMFSENDVDKYKGIIHKELWKNAVKVKKMKKLRKLANVENYDDDSDVEITAVVKVDV